MRTTCAHCTQPLSPRQQRRKGRYCSRRCCFANSLKQRAGLCVLCWLPELVGPALVRGLSSGAPGVEVAGQVSGV